MKIFARTIPFSKDAVWLLDAFKNEKNLFFLDSGLSRANEGRFSYLGFAPFKMIETNDFNRLRAELKPYMTVKSTMPFGGGAVGRISYDGQMRFGLYATVICVDHQRRALTVSATGLPKRTAAAQAREAKEQIRQIIARIEKHTPMLTVSAVGAGLKMTSNTTRAQYIAAVKQALGHIRAGDIYQINLSHRFQGRIKAAQRRVSPTKIYQELRAVSPSDFSAYLDDSTQVILSSSPERFLKFDNRIAQVKPMKGTRPRATTRAKDMKYKNELINSAKEKAELLMVTDLERNDLGRVCEFGSVKVKAMRTIEEYATVFQATSTVEGKLRKDCDQFDLLASTFPSGSVTGCPKIEAMKIIGKLEKAKRGCYTGALGYISFSGKMDFNVLIRTLFIDGNKVTFHVGGGIVADSDPANEYEETLLKATAMTASLERIFK